MAAGQLPLVSEHGTEIVRLTLGMNLLQSVAVGMTAAGSVSVAGTDACPMSALGDGKPALKASASRSPRSVASAVACTVSTLEATLRSIVRDDRAFAATERAPVLEATAAADIEGDRFDEAKLPQADAKAAEPKEADAVSVARASAMVDALMIISFLLSSVRAG